MRTIVQKTIVAGSLLALTLLLGNHPASAQEWNIEASGFVNHQNFDKGLRSGGYSIGVGFSQYLAPSWSIGLEALFAHSEFNYSAMPQGSSFEATDMDGDAFEFRYSSNYYQETDHWSTFQLPVTVQFETQGNTRWYVRTGALFNVLLEDGNSRTILGDLQTSGYYPQWDATLNGPQYAGFGNFGYIERKRDIQFENNIFWVLESGVKLKVGAKKNQSIYLGAFLNVALTSIRPKDAVYGRLMEYTNDINQPLDYQDVWHQEDLKSKKLQDYVFGIRIRYGFGEKK